MASEQMTSLERVAAALSYQKPDRVPVAPLVCGASHRVLGATYDKWSRDSELCADAMIQAQELIGYDAFVTLIDLSVEAADYGQKIVYPLTSTAYTDTSTPVIKNKEDYYKIELLNLRETPRCKMALDVTRRIAKAKGKEVAVVGFVYGPLGILSQLRGHERLFMDCIRHPEAVKHGVEVITEALIDYVKAQVEMGAHSVCLDTLYASQSIMKKEMWEEMEGPWAAKICDAIREAGALVTLHNCGNGIYHDVQEKWLKPVGISHAYPADDCKDWKEHAAKWGKRMVTIGYAEPSVMAFAMSPAAVMEECRKEIEIFKDCDGGFILATGCEFPPNGPLQSAIAMVQAAKMYGVYR